MAGTSPHYQTPEVLASQEEHVPVRTVAEALDSYGPQALHDEMEFLQEVVEEVVEEDKVEEVVKEEEDENRAIFRHERAGCCTWLHLAAAPAVFAANDKNKETNGNVPSSSKSRLTAI